MVVERSVCNKTGSMIDLQEIRLCVLVYEDIKAQNLETHVVSVVVGQRKIVLVSEEGLPGYDSFYDYLIDLLLENECFHTHLS